MKVKKRLIGGNPSLKVNLMTVFSNQRDDLKACSKKTTPQTCHLGQMQGMIIDEERHYCSLN